MFLVDNPKVVEALVKYTGFTKDKIFEVVKPGKGPKITLVEDATTLIANGYFSAKIDANTIFLSRQNITNFENNLFLGNTGKARNALAFSILVTILHETVHFGRFTNGLMDPQTNPDMGTRLEEAGFGFNVQYEINQKVHYKIFMIP